MGKNGKFPYSLVQLLAQLSFIELNAEIWGTFYLFTILLPVPSSLSPPPKPKRLSQDFSPRSRGRQWNFFFELAEVLINCLRNTTTQCLYHLMSACTFKWTLLEMRTTWKLPFHCENWTPLILPRVLERFWDWLWFVNKDLARRTTLWGKDSDYLYGWCPRI